MLSAIERTFGITEESRISNDFIVSHPNPMWDVRDFDPVTQLPSYMAWCVEHGNGDGNLICAGTINALAEAGRSKNPEIAHTSFKFSCNDQQKFLVVQFLYWCLGNLEHEDDDQIVRAIKQWSGG